MVELDIFSTAGEEADRMLGLDFHDDLVYRAVRTFRHNGRAGTASTEDRSQVTGSNKKPWRQKGTGRARHGSRQSPLWAGGGVTFGPEPKDWSIDLPKKMQNKAIRSALSTRYREDRFKVVDKLEFERPKTKEGLAILDELDLPENVLIILSESEDNWKVRKTFSNLPKANCIPASYVATYFILKHEAIMSTEGALEELEARLMKKSKL